MDIIEKAIANGSHITGIDKLNRQTWEQFQKECSGKRVFLFGLGVVSGFFIDHYNTKVRLEGVIDNDKRKQGFCVGEFVGEALNTQYENLIISDVSVLGKYNADEVAVLITSINFYQQIIEQIKQFHINNYYFLLTMEANRRKKASMQVQDLLQIKASYVKECCKLEIQKKKIVIYIGYYGGHGKYITQQLLIQNPELDIVWVVKDLTINRPEGVRVVFEGNWKRYIYEIETAHIWIYDIIVPAYFIKRDGQFYIQTKHWSSITLKKFFLDDLSTTSTEEQIDQVKYNGKIIDYIFSGSRFDEETCKSGFDFHGKFIQIGSARTDALFVSGNRKKIYQRYNMREENHSILYAPTFRYEKAVNKKSFHLALDFKGLTESLESRFGGSWYILLRLHPSIAGESSKIEKRDYVIDVSDYDDSQELVAACDVTISDYSSIMFEPAFVYKPVFLFAPDRQQYIDNERELLIDYSTLPFTLAESNEELAQNIKRFDQAVYEKNVDAFMKKYGVHEDGHASERAAEFVLELMDRKSQENDLCQKLL